MTSNEEPNFQLPNHTSTPAQLSLQSNQINSCPKHPEKKMKFLLKNEKNQKFCSKCTLIEALKGGKVELDLSIFEKYKRDQLEKLQSNLEQNKTKLLLFQNELKEKKDFLDITYTQHFSNLNNLFSKILKTIYDTQNELCLKFDANIQVMKAKIKSQMTFVWDSQKEIDKILGDISNNYQNIITEMKVDSFKGVCGLYEEKITTMGDKVASLANEHYEYLLFEENTKQIQNFKLLDLQKLYNVFKKTSFLSPKIQEIIKNVKINIDRNDGSTECSNMRTLMTKNNSIHEESNRNSLFSNPSSILFATKENSNCKSNQTSKKELLTDEKTQKKMKNNSSIHIRMFLNTSSHEKISGVENNKVFQTERDRKKKRTKSKIPHNFMPHAISIDILNDKN